jgi:putative endonuclease
MNDNGNDKDKRRPGGEPNRASAVLSGKKDTRRTIGTAGEDAAAAYLESEGYTLLHRNWRCRSGEIDIVAGFEETIVFIEVRTRTSEGRFGTAAESVDMRKQLQVRSTAQVYLHTLKRFGYAVRFDVIALVLERESGGIKDLKHIKAAF